jgi:hypothetical protein
MQRGLRAPDFETRTARRVPSRNNDTRGNFSSEDGILWDLAPRMADCSQNRMWLKNDAIMLSVVAPWAGDVRTLPFRAREDDKAEDVATRIVNNPFVNDSSFVRFDSITLLTSAGIGHDLQRQLKQLTGRDVRVYEPTGLFLYDQVFTIEGGGHWEMFGQLSNAQIQARIEEVAASLRMGFPHADSLPPRPGELIPFAARAATQDLLATALAAIQASRADVGGDLDLTVAARILEGHATPEHVWPSLMRLLAGELGDVQQVADMYLHEGQWRSVDVVRHHYMATGPHHLVDGLGWRRVTFNRPIPRLLSDGAATRPEANDARIRWLAELILDRKPQGLPAEPADVSGDSAQVHRDLIAQLEALGASSQNAHLWADESVHGARVQAAVSQQVGDDGNRGVEADLVGEAPDDDARSTLIDVPLGGGVLWALEKIPEAANALADGYAMAAHFLRDTSGINVAAADVRGMLTPENRSVGIVAEVIALLRLRTQEFFPSVGGSTTEIEVLETVSEILYALEPDVRGFVYRHERDVVELFTSSIPALSDTPFNLFKFESSRELDGFARDRAATTTRGATAPPWLLPTIRLRITGQSPQDVEEIAEAAHYAGSLNTGLDWFTKLPATATSTALSKLRDAIDDIVNEYPELSGQAQAGIEGAYRRAVVPWLAKAMAGLPPRTAGPDDSVRRIKIILAAAELIQDLAKATAPALAWAVRGEWRDATVDSLWRLQDDDVTLVWVQLRHALEHVVLVQRTSDGLAIIETQTEARTEISYVADVAAAEAILRGPLRVVVDARDSIVTLSPDERERPVDQAPRSNASLAGGVPAPSFGPSASVGSRPSGPKIEHLMAGHSTVIIVDVRNVTRTDVDDALNDPVTGGVLVVHGATEAISYFDDLARERGMHLLQPLSSDRGRPVVATSADGHLISPTGWRVISPDGSYRIDLNGAIVIDHLVASSDRPAVLARRRVSYAARPVLPGLPTLEHEPRAPDPAQQKIRLVDAVPEVSEDEPTEVRPAPDSIRSESGAARVRIALANLYLPLDVRPWDAKWKDRVGAEAYQHAARMFGEQAAALLAGQLAGVPIDQSNVTDFLHIESVAIVRSIATLAYLEGSDPGQRPVRSKVPLAEVIGRLNPTRGAIGPRDPRYLTSEGAGVFLQTNLPELLARRLGESITTDLVPADPIGESEMLPDEPASIELELLSPGGQLTPLPSLDPAVLATLHEQFGEYSDSALDIYLRARSDDGRRVIASAFAEERAAQAQAAGKARAQGGAAQQTGDSPRQLDRSVWAYLPGRPLESLAPIIADVVRGLRTGGKTVTVSGVVASDGGQVGISDGHRMVNHQALTRTVARLASSAWRRPYVMVLALHGEPHSVLGFAQRVQAELDQNALLGHPVPALVVGAFRTLTKEFAWYTVEPGTREVRGSAGLRAALAAVRDLALAPLDIALEMRNRMEGHTSYPEIDPDRIIEVAAAMGLELPPYSSVDQAAFSSFPDDLVYVPVRRGAPVAEHMDTARMWLQPGAIREMAFPGSNGDTVPVMIGAGLTARGHHLPATTSADATGATTVTAAGEGVWINRFRQMNLRGVPFVYAAVATNVHVPPAFLDTLPTDVRERLIIEPGEYGDGLQITNDGTYRVSGAVYGRRLPLSPRPIVILSHPQVGGLETPPFIAGLASYADVIRLVRPHTTSRDLEWRALVKNETHTFDSIEAALDRWLSPHRFAPARQLISTGRALKLLQNNQVKGPDSDAAVVIRRGLARKPLYDQETIDGYLRLPPDGATDRPSLLQHYPAGLARLNRREITSRPSLWISHLPVRYVGRIGGGDGTADVVDLARLVADGGRLLGDGTVVVPRRPAIPDVGQRVRESLRAKTMSITDEQTHEQWFGSLFRELTGIASNTGESDLSAWADHIYAQFRSQEPSFLKWLRPGGVTPVRLRTSEIVVAVGTETRDRPLLFSRNGDEADLRKLDNSAIELLLDAEGRLAQVNLGDSRSVIVDAAGPVEAPPDYVSEHTVQRVAEQIQATGLVVPHDLRQRLSRRLSRRPGRPTSVVSRSEVEDLAQVEAMGSAGGPVDGAARRIERASRLSLFFEPLDPALQEIPESQVPASQEEENTLERREPAPPVPRSAPVRQNQSLPPQLSPPPRPPSPAPPSRGSSLPAPQAFAAFSDTPYPPVLNFDLGENDRRVRVTIVDTQRAEPSEVEKMLAPPIPNARVRGFLVLSQTDFNEPFEHVYQQIAFDRGLRLVRPLGDEPGRSATAGRPDPYELSSPNGWLIRDEYDQWWVASEPVLDSSNFLSLFESPDVHARRLTTERPSTPERARERVRARTDLLPSEPPMVNPSGYRIDEPTDRTLEAWLGEDGSSTGVTAEPEGLPNVDADPGRQSQPERRVNTYPPSQREGLRPAGARKMRPPPSVRAEIEQSVGGQIIEGLLGKAEPAGASALIFWAEGLRAQFHPAAPDGLSLLRPGALTVVRLRPDRLILATGTDQTGQFRWFGTDGNPIGPMSLDNQTIELLLDAYGGLAQIEIPADRPRDAVAVIRWPLPPNVDKLETFFAEHDDSDFVQNLVAWRFGGGLRSVPDPAAEPMNTMEWVRARLDNPTMSGGHQPKSWHDLSQMIGWAGEGGMVVTYEYFGEQPVVYTATTDGAMWRIRHRPGRVETVRWTKPPELPNVARPRFRAFVFNRCGDPLPDPADVAGGPRSSR